MWAHADSQQREWTIPISLDFPSSTSFSIAAQVVSKSRKSSISTTGCVWSVMKVCVNKNGRKAHLSVRLTECAVTLGLGVRIWN